MFFVHVLKSLATSRGYVGLTTDISRRLEEHNGGKSYYTKRHAPWAVIHVEEYLTRPEARSREKFLKSTAGRRVLKELFS